jgi:glycosyltransferase involved in cell wall biosynthesis
MGNRIFYLTIDPVEYRQRIQNQLKLARELGLEATVFSLGESDESYDDERYDFEILRIMVSFKSGPLRFITFNVLAFLKLWFKPCDILHFRSIWVIPAVLFYRIFHRCILVYDANEYFAGHKLFNESIRRKLFWLSFEKLLIPYINILLTVSEPLAGFYRKRYPSLSKIEVIRNLPKRNLSLGNTTHQVKKDAKITRLIFHGFFLPGRALLQIIRALAGLKDLFFDAQFIGDGILRNDLMKNIKWYQLEEHVQIMPFVTNEKLLPLISQADIGLSIIEPDCINRTYALPNKFFEFIMAGVPVLVSHIPTLSSYVERYNIGRIVDPFDIEQIRQTLREMISDKKGRLVWKENCKIAARELNWENESIKMRSIYQELINTL